MNNIENDNAAEIIIEKVKHRFSELYDTEPSIFTSPGRINLIGEHTDYNQGLVLPAAIDKVIVLAISKREDAQINIFSESYQKLYAGTLENLEPSGILWPDYILGVIVELQKRGCELSGVDIVFDGNIPQGAGLSSSAALECAAAFGINEIFDLKLSSLEIAKIGQAAENNFVGVQCGLMDQFASVFGKSDHLIKLDCESFEFNFIPFNAKNYKVVLFDTGVKHSLASSAYNERRSQCESGVELVQEHHPDVDSLRRVSQQMLDDYVKGVDPVVYNRCAYVVKEIQRLQDACEDLLKGDLETFGKRMYETHEGLRDEYEVSCEELDYLVDRVKAHPEVIGARMMGGGFGGCTINLIQSESVDRVVEETSNAYKRDMDRELKVYFVSIEDGTKRVL
ncbi:galactokinase [Albibacterium indicum]|uniref:galactokinase n=1 Tax=Albibacterium indicum TaxID=2292082 RepID=UPI000E4EE13F|nr:galactokinase [Pedobacter indicus]